jgi:hypothetical protein
MRSKSLRKQTSEAEVGRALLLCPYCNRDDNCPSGSAHPAKWGSPARCSIVDDRQLLPHFQAYPCGHLYEQSGPFAAVY